VASNAKNPCDHLSGFNVCNSYLVVLYYQPNKAFEEMDADKIGAGLAQIEANIGLQMFGQGNSEKVRQEHG